MSYSLWHRGVMKKAGIPSDRLLYTKTVIFSLLVFVTAYLYTVWLKIPNPLNKAVADTSIVLIGLSMLLTSLCYFWDFVDTKIIYRKYLGIVGFVYGVVHIVLSFSALERLFLSETWQKGTYWPALTGVVALGIFSLMTLISNKYAAQALGGTTWRKILRVGYVAVGLIWLHVFLLKSARIINWYKEGMVTPPSMSLLVLAFMLMVVLMRVLLWLSLRKEKVR
ncbi:ferric reductase-like transmembrane domain-containing protein [Candidatus Microgenomates bacterium]|nr:ferric reductase-like transmembrane domain-containing protein [Candidatus Microgenomates bacterium]